ncbi:MAG: 1-acyl-sn-glycerol-3-phosphate acyltransferase [Nitrospirae bacterium]|nr:1-acyl-sn-glycerol-3-phosphate acyltransferase [Nitrospirota bacterium]
MNILGRILYTIAHVIIFILAKLLFSLKVTGQENIPENGGVIIASNHLSYMDIPIMACSIKRPVNFIGKRELFSIPILGSLFRILGGIPIDREKIDRTALREIIKRLNAGSIIVIYPEGTRSLNGRLQPGKPGVGLFVRMSGKRVVPAAIQGTDKAMPAGSWLIRPAPVSIKFGRPLDFSEFGRKEGFSDEPLMSPGSQRMMKIPLNPPFSKGEIRFPPLEKGGKSPPFLKGDLGGLWGEGGFEKGFSDEKEGTELTITNIIMDNIAALLKI